MSATRRPGRLAALRAFMAKEVRHILRDRQTLTILLLLPLAQVVLFGYALRTDVREVRVAFVASAPDVATTALRDRLAHGGRTRLVATATDTRALAPRFRAGDVDVAVVVEAGLGDRLGRGETVAVQLIADASDPNTGATMQAYVAAVVREWEGEMVAAHEATRGRRTQAPVRLEPRHRMRYNPTLESVNLFVPGLIALIVTLVSTLMTAISLSREKERGSLEVLLVSPLRPWQVITGKVAPYLVLAFANVVTALLAAWLVFGVPFRGSLALLLWASALFALVGLALGVLIAAVTPSQIAAMLAALGGTMLPNALLSGLIFPIASLPAPLQVLTNVVPARWFIVVARGVMLKDAGFPELWQELAILALMAAVFMALAMRRFPTRLA